MAVKWRDYLSRKGLSLASWIDANGISSVDGLRVRLEQLGIVLLPDDVRVVEALLSKKASPAQVPVVQETSAEPAEPVILDDRPKKRRKAQEHSDE